MNKQNIVKSARYRLLWEYRGVAPHSVKVFFYRNKLDILNSVDVNSYINKN